MRTNQLLKIYVTSDPNLEPFVTNDNELKKNMVKVKMPHWEPKIPIINNLNIFLANILLENPRHRVIYNYFPSVFKIWVTEFIPDRIISTGFFGDMVLVKYNDCNFVKKVVDPKLLGYKNIEDYAKLVETYENSQFTPNLMFAF